LAGGVDIETVANDSPEMIMKVSIDLATGLQAYQCRKIAYSLGMKGLK
jgi:Succinyl-CoA synthetase, beta subunit